MRRRVREHKEATPNTGLQEETVHAPEGGSGSREPKTKAPEQQAPPPQTESVLPEPRMLADRETRKRRYLILKRYRDEKGLPTMGDLARRAGASVTAVQGMVRGDRTRYAEAKLEDFLELIGVAPSDW
jgi:hypothetical protein